MKFKSFLSAHKGLIKDVVTSTCLLGGSAGIVFGVSAATFKIQYIEMENAQKRLEAWQSRFNYESQRISSCWNMTNAGVDIPQKEMTTLNDWKSWHPDAENAPFLNTELGIDKKEDEEALTQSEREARYAYTSLIVDGATHSVMDRSFNQQLFEGLADFNWNKKLDDYSIDLVNAYKPTQDNTQDFITTYTSVIRKHTVVGLAGFNHATPLTSMMSSHYGEGDEVKFARCTDEKLDKEAQKTGFILLDSSVPDNQCVASVLFRADQPGFLTGVATCSYLIHNLQIYHDHYQDLSVAEYGGVPIPTVTVYMGGFQRGVELFNKGVLGYTLTIGAYEYLGQSTGHINAQKCHTTFENILLPHSKYKDEIKEIKSAPTVEERIALYEEHDLYNKLLDEFSIKMIKLGDASNHFSGTFAAGDAIGITKQYLNRGASAIICVAGPQSLDTAQEIQNQHSKAIVVGVDTAMENSDYQKYHAGCDASTNAALHSSDEYWDRFVDTHGNHSSQSHAIIKFSAIKDLKAVSKKITRLIATGKNWNVSDPDSIGANEQPDPKKAICGPGFQTCGNILNGMVGISWDGFVPLMDALQHLIYFDDSGEIGLIEAWIKAEQKYEEQIVAQGETLPIGYAESAANLYDLMTYNRNAIGGLLYQCYNHTTNILGILLNDAKLEFYPTMSLMPVDQSEDPDLSKGFTTIPEGETRTYSILQWLDYNMYIMN